MLLGRCASINCGLIEASCVASVRPSLELTVSSQDITDKYNSLTAAQKSQLGKVIRRHKGLGDPTIPGGSGGLYRNYTNGAIYSYLPSGFLTPNGFAVWGAVYTKWMALGGHATNSLLGLPSTDCLTPKPGLTGCIFQNGAIASSANGVFETHGNIFTRWLLRNGFAGIGAPLTDETITADNRGGRFNEFENGSIFMIPGQLGPHDVSRNMRVVWGSTAPGLEPEQGALGYPIMSPQQTIGPGTNTNFQDFEKGTIYEMGLGNQFIVLRTPSTFFHSFDQISWNSFGTVWADGDLVTAAFGVNFPQFDVNVTLVGAPNITRRKTVSLWSPSLGYIQQVSTQGSTETAKMSLDPASLAISNRYLLFEKEKDFAGFPIGVHTYLLPLPDRLIGSNVTFTWLKD
jgi:hypothetical protein